MERESLTLHILINNNITVCKIYVQYNNTNIQCMRWQRRLSSFSNICEKPRYSSRIWKIMNLCVCTVVEDINPKFHTYFSLYHSIAIFHYQADCLLNFSACKIHISIRQSDPRLLAKFRRSPSWRTWCRGGTAAAPPASCTPPPAASGARSPSQTSHSSRSCPPSVKSSAVKRSIGFTTGFHNHWEGPY